MIGLLQNIPNIVRENQIWAKAVFVLKKTDDIPYELLAKLVRKMTVLDWVSLYEEKFKK